MSASNLLEGGGEESTPLLGGTKKRNTFVLVVLPPVIVYVCGLVLLTRWEGTDFLTANYVIAQIVTTVGYGDLTVQTAEGKVFMAIYALVVLVILAYYFNMFVGAMVDKRCDHLRSYLRAAERLCDSDVPTDAAARMKYGATNLTIATGILFSVCVVFGTIFYRMSEHCTCSDGATIVEGCDESTFERCQATGGFVKNWGDCFYMSVVTLTTVGFGDYHPHTQWGHVVGTIWMLFGVVCTGSFLGALTSFIFEADKRRSFSQADAIRCITEKKFKQIDRDGNGYLSRGEFLAFTLARYGIVDEQLMDAINAVYDGLDSGKTNRVSYASILDKQHKVARHSHRLSSGAFAH